MKYPHLFLIVENDTLTVGEPGPSSGESGSGSSEAMNREEFMEEFLIRHGQVITFFRQQENCYIAFDEEGAVHGPCSLSISDPETRMHMVPVFD